MEKVLVEFRTRCGCSRRVLYEMDRAEPKNTIVLPLYSKIPEALFDPSHPGHEAAKKKYETPTQPAEEMRRMFQFEGKTKDWNHTTIYVYREVDPE